MGFKSIQGLYTSCTIEASLTKPDVYQHILSDIYLKFHEILFSGYLVMALDIQTEGWMERRLDRHGKKQYPSDTDSLYF